MTIRFHSIAALFLLLAFDALAEEDSFLCIADRAVGFLFDESSKSWKNANFNITDDKYIVRPANEENDHLPLGYKYGVWKFGGSQVIPSHMCKDSFSDAGLLVCDYSIFKMNRFSGRYIIISGGTYVTSTLEIVIENAAIKSIANVPDAGGDTPYIEIGTCSKI